VRKNGERLKVEHGADLVYLTYYMVDWKGEPQTPTSQPCSQCGQEMSRIEAEVGDKQGAYEGLVCHRCKRVTWVRKD